MSFSKDTKSTASIIQQKGDWFQQMKHLRHSENFVFNINQFLQLHNPNKDKDLVLIHFSIIQLENYCTKNMPKIVAENLSSSLADANLFPLLLFE